MFYLFIYLLPYETLTSQLNWEINFVYQEKAYLEDLPRSTSKGIGYEKSIWKEAKGDETVANKATLQPYQSVCSSTLHTSTEPKMPNSTQTSSPHKVFKLIIFST